MGKQFKVELDNYGEWKVVYQSDNTLGTINNMIRDKMKDKGELMKASVQEFTTADPCEPRMIEERDNLLKLSIDIWSEALGRIVDEDFVRTARRLAGRNDIKGMAYLIETGFAGPY